MYDVTDGNAERAMKALEDVAARIRELEPRAKVTVEDGKWGGNVRAELDGESVSGQIKEQRESGYRRNPYLGKLYLAYNDERYRGKNVREKAGEFQVEKAAQALVTVLQRTIERREAEAKAKAYRDRMASLSAHTLEALGADQFDRLPKIGETDASISIPSESFQEYRGRQLARVEIRSVPVEKLPELVDAIRAVLEKEAE